MPLDSQYETPTGPLRRASPITELLEQDKLWVGFSGDAVPIAQMGISQSVMVVLALQRKASRLFVVRVRELQDDGEFRAARLACHLGVWGWFESRPLIRALRLNVRVGDR